LPYAKEAIEDYWTRCLIKREGKIPFQQFITRTSKQISFQITNNNYMIAPTFPNPYITRTLNNMDEAQTLNKKQDN